MSWAAKANTTKNSASMDNDVVELYRQVLAVGRPIDDSDSNNETSAINDFLCRLNPPPDKLVSLRATAFKVACDYLSTTDRDVNINLLRTLNYIVHAIEHTLMEPKQLPTVVPFDEDAVTTFYQSILDDHIVDGDENTNLYTFFQSTHPTAPDDMIQLRALAFKVGCDNLSDTNDKDTNVELLRCVNVLVHVLEQTYFKPKQYSLQLPEPTIQRMNTDMTLAQAVQHLWDLDANRLTPDVDYVLNVQRGKKPFWKEDAAPDPLFSMVDSAVWKRPTYHMFMALLDNYNVSVGQAEVITNVEKRENTAFLQAILQTAPMQFCHQYCHAKKPNVVPSDLGGFQKLLQTIWFDLYRRTRGGKTDSCGFEHVFVGEVKDDGQEVTGFHNWIQFYLEEKAGNLDYRGCIKPKALQEAQADSNDHLLSLQFHWHGGEKFVSSSFIGVSPEFEIALYTMCFLVGEENNDLELHTGTDLFKIRIKCYSMAHDKIGTSYPEVIAHYEE